MAADTTQDLYAVLGLHRTGAITEEDVKMAYKRMSVIYHPDKYTSPEQRHAAEQIFQNVHTAYTGIKQAPS
jgi:DnaJ-class molecular chaperone